MCIMNASFVSILNRTNSPFQIHVSSSINNGHSESIVSTTVPIHNPQFQTNYFEQIRYIDRTPLFFCIYSLLAFAKRISYGCSLLL